MNMKKLGYNLRRQRSIYKKIPIKMKLKYCLKKKRWTTMKAWICICFAYFSTPGSWNNIFTEKACNKYCQIYEKSDSAWKNESLTI